MAEATQSRTHRAIFDKTSIALAIAAAAWFIFAANHYTVFDDEGFSTRLYAMPMTEMLGAQWDGADPDPPIYYILQNLSVSAFGVSPIALRTLSILCAVASLFTIRAAAAAWFGSRAGFAAMLIAAFHPAHLFFGFAARWYALFLLLSTALLWLTGRVYRRGAINRRDALAWGALAAASALTNYFGLVITGLLGLVLFARLVRTASARTPLAIAAATSLAVFAIWLKPFVQHLTTFRDSSPGGSVLATLARMLVALTTGNLASIGAYWVWIPMSLAGFFGVAILIRSWRTLAPVAVVLFGCILVGTLTRTILDKYILTFSGIACVLLAGLFTDSNVSEQLPSKSRLRLLAPIFLAIAWFGCGVNLVTEQHWSSLRWLDPIDATIEHAVKRGASDDMLVVTTHPSARYYAALRVADDKPRQRFARVSATEWLNAFQSQEQVGETIRLAQTPTAILERLRRGESIPTLFTLETSGFESLPDWELLHATLHRDYEKVETWNFLSDPDAALKDKLDPTIHHAPWRITLQKWSKPIHN